MCDHNGDGWLVAQHCCFSCTSTVVSVIGRFCLALSCCSLGSRRRRRRWKAWSRSAAGRDLPHQLVRWHTGHTRPHDSLFTVAANVACLPEHVQGFCRWKKGKESNSTTDSNILDIYIWLLFLLCTLWNTERASDFVSLCLVRKFTCTFYMVRMQAHSRQVFSTVVE